MEKKTIGGFIAALRKANGMTQKELAERLNVSDKTVSRWERDDGAPDLAVIPIIAEIFGVTCDELLRGERKSPTERTESAEETTTSAKGSRELQRLLKSTLSQYKSRTYIAMGVSVVGLIVALIFNLAFLRASLGFLAGAIFFAASIVCQAVFMNRANLSVEDAGLGSDVLSVFKRSVIRLAKLSIGLTVAFIGFTFPLILVDAYLGLGADSLLIWGGIGAAAFLLVYAIVLYFLNASLLKRGAYSLPEREAAVYHHNHKLQGKCGITLAVVLALTLVVHTLGSQLLWSSAQISASYGTTFTDYESFVEYMERDIQWDGYQFSENTAVAQLPSDSLYEEDHEIHSLKDANGNVVCTFVQRNHEVSSIRYEVKEDTVLPITVITMDDLYAASAISSRISTAYCALYLIEVLVTAAVYRKKREKA